MAALVVFCAFTGSTATEAATKPKASKQSEDKAGKQDLTVIAGIQSTFDLPFEPCKLADSKYEQCIKILNKKILSVTYIENKKQLIFEPISKGETTVTIRDTNADVRLILNVVVSDSNLVRRLKELKELLRDIEGIEMKIMADKIVVDGEVVVIGDLNRMYAVLSDPAYKDLVLNLVTISPVGLQIMAERMQSEINNPNVKVRVMNGLFVLEGQVDSMSEAQRAKDIAYSMVQGFALPTYSLQGPSSPVEVRKPNTKDPIIVRITVAPRKADPPPKMVRITIDFVELSKDYLRNFGFSWSPNLDSGGSVAFGQSTTGGVTTQGNGSLSGTIGNLFPRLSAAQNAGYARILEESVLIVKLGQTAVFKRTLDVPVQTTNDKGQPTFNVVKIGPSMNITPRLQGQSEDVNLFIDFAYSGLAGKQGTAPIVLNHVYKTEVVVRSAESAAIVNALSNTISTAFNKDPPGGVVPASPLFTLLRSKAFQKNKSQFVVFVTPQILESSWTGTEDIKKRYGIKRKQ